MLNLIKNNQKFLENLPLLIKNEELKEKIVNNLNKEKLLIISGIRGAGKENIISNVIINSNYKNNYFYFNKDLDFHNQIKSEKDLNLLFSTYTKTYNFPSIIILENSHNIKGFKEFLSKIYKEKKYKIFILGNGIKIGGKPIITIHPISIKQLYLYKTYNYNVTDLLQYGSLQDIFLINSNYLKKRYLELQKEHIIYNDIIKSYYLKNIKTYNHTVIFLSLLGSYKSLRELNKLLNQNTKIPLNTMIEYIDYSIKANIINKMWIYDLKLKKEIISKAKYYFTDNGIRNSFNGFNTDLYILKENLIYNELIKNGYKVNGGINGRFEFSFIGKRINNFSPLPGVGNIKIKIDTMYIHISKQTESEEVKKEVRKLLKTPFIPTKIDGEDSEETISKYLIVENIKYMKLKKLQYEDVRIMEFEEFIPKTLA